MVATDSLSQSPSVSDGAQPRVWLLLGDKRGDNAQVETIEQALAWPCEHKYLHMREPYVLGKPRVEASLHHIDLSQSDPLEPPWPDLIITIGRRPSMAALWVREQSRGFTKLVLLGKPSGMMERFDLVIASAETQLPPLPNVLPITLPLMQVSEASVAAAVATWQSRLEALPRPLIGVLVGGATGPFVFDGSVVDRLVEVATEIVEDTGGTPYFTTSRRTPPAVVAALNARLPPGARLFAWTPEATDNPYRGLLGLADGFLVTGDSISMMVEVVRLNKPLAIFPLPTSRMGSIDQLRRSFTRWLFSTSQQTPLDRIRLHLARAAFRTGLLTHTRDFKAFHQLLIDHGLAVGVGEAFRPTQGEVPDELPRVIHRIEALLEDR